MTDKEEQSQRLREELDRAIEILREDPCATDIVAGMLVEALEEENGPVAIYAAPAMAYGVPPVYQATERVKRWNRDHHHHPFREIQLVRELHSQGLDANQVDAVLDVLDNICTGCWDNARGCQCDNDR